MSMITITQYRNALYDILAAQRDETPGNLRKVFRFRPGGLGEMPAAWVGDMVDDIGIVGGTRERTISADVLIAAPFPTDLIELADPFDAVRDALVERFGSTTTATVIANSILELTAIVDGEVSLQGAERVNTYRGMTLSTRLRIWEGRD